MSNLNESVKLRATTSADADFLLQVYMSSRGDDLRALGWDEERISKFLEMQYEAQQTFDKNDHQQAMDEVVLYSGARAGRLFVESRENELRCLDVALLPEFRNRGLGTFLLRRMQQQATNSHRPLRLQVIRFNRAVSLFERLGFVRTSETGTHLQMEWTPPGSKS